MGIRSGYGNENENEKRKMGKWNCLLGLRAVRVLAARVVV